MRKIAKGSVWNPLKRATLEVCKQMFPWGIMAESPEGYLTVSRDRETFRNGNWNHGELPRVPLVQIFPELTNGNLAISNAFSGVPGTSLDAQEIVVLAAITRMLGARRILEIGTYDGNTTLNLALNSPPDAMITTLDLPQNWDGTLALDIPDSAVNVLDGNGERVEIGRQYKSHPEVLSKIVQVFCDSATIDWEQFDGPFDLIFIDGCHDYTYVKADTKNAVANLRPGGVVVWHDYAAMQDVSRLVDEISASMHVNSISGTRFAVGFPHGGRGILGSVRK